MQTNFGDININEDVVASIAALAAIEVDGLDAIANSSSADIIKKNGIKSTSKALKIILEEEHVTAEVYIVIKYGFSIPTVTSQIQERIKNSIENMTGFTVDSVNVHVIGINVGTLK